MLVTTFVTELRPVSDQFDPYIRTDLVGKLDNVQRRLAERVKSHVIVTICTYVLLCTYGLCYFAFTDCVIIVVVALFALHCYSAVRLSS